MKKGQVNDKITDLIALSRFPKTIKIVYRDNYKQKYYLRDPAFP